MNKNDINPDWVRFLSSQYDPDQDLWYIDAGKDLWILSLVYNSIPGLSFKEHVAIFLDRKYISTGKFNAPEGKKNTQIVIRKIQEIINANNVFLNAHFAKQISSQELKLEPKTTDLTTADTLEKEIKHEPKVNSEGKADL